MVNSAAPELELRATRTAGKVHPPYRAFGATLVSNEQLSPSFRRLVFTGPLLHHFDDTGWDQRVKLVLPTTSGQQMPDLGQNDDWALESFAWRDRWKALEDPSIVRIRSYSVAEVDQGNQQVTIDFVVHEETPGPGSNFALTARPGAEIIIAGPDARSSEGPMGIDYRPGDAQEILLVADESALPAVRSILRQTPVGGPRIHAFVELPTVADAIDLQACGHELDLVLRGPERGKNLITVVNNWCIANPNALRLGEDQDLAPIDIDKQRLWETATATDGGFYAWMAGEAAVIKELRRILVQEKKVDRRKVSFMGYWREGHALNKG